MHFKMGLGQERNQIGTCESQRIFSFSSYHLGRVSVCFLILLSSLIAGCASGTRIEDLGPVARAKAINENVKTGRLILDQVAARYNDISVEELASECQRAHALFKVSHEMSHEARAPLTGLIKIDKLLGLRYMKEFSIIRDQLNNENYMKTNSSKKEEMLKRYDEYKGLGLAVYSDLKKYLLQFDRFVVRKRKEDYEIYHDLLETCRILGEYQDAYDWGKLFLRETPDMTAEARGNYTRRFLNPILTLIEKEAGGIDQDL